MSPRLKPGMYSRTDGRPVLTASIVAFVDVLGISEHATGDDAQSVVEKLDDALDRARRRSQVDEEFYWTNSSWFSDNLALASALGDEQEFWEGIFASVIIGASWLQFMLAIEGFFLRGGVTFGDQFMDDRINFGPALVEAVKLEKLAVNPRIVLSETVTRLTRHFCTYYADGYDNPFGVHLAVLPDRTLFLSYLSVVNEADDVQQALDMLTLHRDAVVAQLDNSVDDPHVHEKYRWLAGYHNFVCRGFAEEDTYLLVPGTFDEAVTAFVPAQYFST